MFTGSAGWTSSEPPADYWGEAERYQDYLYDIVKTNTNLNANASTFSTISLAPVPEVAGANGTYLFMKDCAEFSLNGDYTEDNAFLLKAFGIALNTTSATQAKAELYTILTETVGIKATSQSEFLVYNGHYDWALVSTEITSAGGTINFGWSFQGGDAAHGADAAFWVLKDAETGEVIAGGVLAQGAAAASGIAEIDLPVLSEEHTYVLTVGQMNVGTYNSSQDVGNPHLLLGTIVLNEVVYVEIEDGLQAMSFSSAGDESVYMSDVGVLSASTESDDTLEVSSTGAVASTENVSSLGVILTGTEASTESATALAVSLAGAAASTESVSAPGVSLTGENTSTESVDAFGVSLTGDNTSTESDTFDFITQDAASTYTVQGEAGDASAESQQTLPVDFTEGSENASPLHVSSESTEDLSESEQAAPEQIQVSSESELDPGGDASVTFHDGTSTEGFYIENDDDNLFFASYDVNSSMDHIENPLVTGDVGGLDTGGTTNLGGLAVEYESLDSLDSYLPSVQESDAITEQASLGVELTDQSIIPENATITDVSTLEIDLAILQQTLQNS